MNVLIVDDAMLIRTQLKKFFKSDMKFEVVATGNDGEQAVDLYKNHNPDLTTLDLTMPNKDGIDALSEILDYDPKAKVIVISAIKDVEKITKALEIGAADYIKKPLQLTSDEFKDSLKKTIHDALE